MKERNKGILLLALFGIWTKLVLTVDVEPAGETGKAVGFAAVNTRFHQWTGVHMELYTVTDWLGLVPVAVCLLFGTVGFVQLMRRRSLRKVDGDLILLGGYYIAVILAYLAFEQFPVNYRPILIEGRAEASYPSSTTLLVLSVMPTLAFQARRRLRSAGAKKVVCLGAGAFSAAMTVGRAVSGVHWITDIVGSVLLSMGLFCLYRGAALRCKNKADGE